MSQRLNSSTHLSIESNGRKPACKKAGSLVDIYKFGIYGVLIP